MPLNSSRIGPRRPPRAARLVGSVAVVAASWAGGWADGRQAPSTSTAAPAAPAAREVPEGLNFANGLFRERQYKLAADEYERFLRAQPSAPFADEARYGLALAYYRSDQPDEARRLIEGTAALHPELGGGELAERFQRLRRRLDQR